MARYMAARISSSEKRRRSQLSRKNPFKFKRHRTPRFAQKKLASEVCKLATSDGVWPIVPYLVNSNSHISKPSISGSVDCNTQIRKSIPRLRKEFPKRFNVFEKLIQEEKKSSAFDLTVLSEESTVQGEKELSLCDITVLSEGPCSSEDRITSAQTEDGNLSSRPSSDIGRKINLESSERSKRDETSKIDVSLSTHEENAIEVITLTDDAEDEDLGAKYEYSEDEIVVIDEIITAPTLITASKPLDLCVNLESSMQKFPSYSYRILKETASKVTALSYPDMRMIMRLPHADGGNVFNDLLSEGAAKLTGRLLRHWENVQNCVSKGMLFRICSYNVLCQDTMAKTDFLYKHLRNRIMDWNARSCLLAREFLMMNADILCLQEIQNSHYTAFYKPFFETRGYKGTFKKRTRHMVDGCAIFYRTTFDLVSKVPIEYFVSSQTILDRDNVGQIVRLRHKNTGREFCVANTHLLFNARRGDIKLAQLTVLLAHLDKICGTSSTKPCPYILCGDFNMAPYSPLYNFLLNNCLSLDNLHRNDLSGQGFHGGPLLRSDFMPRETKINSNCQFENLNFEALSAEKNKTSISQKHCWTHTLNFASIYSHFDAYDKREISSFNCAKASNPDFIFYSVCRRVVKDDEEANYVTVNVFENSLKLMNRLSLPNEEVLRETVGPWPNCTVPSDHIPLVADFSLT